MTRDEVVVVLLVVIMRITMKSGNGWWRKVAEHGLGGEEEGGQQHPQGRVADGQVPRLLLGHGGGLREEPHQPTPHLPLRHPHDLRHVLPTDILLPRKVLPPTTCLVEVVVVGLTEVFLGGSGDNHRINQIMNNWKSSSLASHEIVPLKVNVCSEIDGRELTWITKLAGTSKSLHLNLRFSWTETTLFLSKYSHYEGWNVLSYTHSKVKFSQRSTVRSIGMVQFLHRLFSSVAGC